MTDTHRDPRDARWITSTYSTSTGNNCVEVGQDRRVVGVRDTKRRDAGTLTVRPTTWSAFIHGVQTHHL